MSKVLRRAYEFGSFHLDPDERRLLNAGRAVPLTPKAFQTLVLLVERSGQLVAKDELIREVWPGIFVEEGGLTRNISVLRKALGDDQTEQRFIETVPKLGYRFVSPVRSVDADVSASLTPSGRAKAWWPGRHGSELATLCLLLATVGIAVVFRHTRSSSPVESPSQATTIAVFPFQDVGATPLQDHVGLGIADALITRLAQIKQISVTPTSATSPSASHYQEPFAVARTLSVQFLLNGTFHRVGDRIRVTAQLVNVSNRQLLWAGTFDEAFRDVFSVQDQIAGRVADVLLVPLGREERQPPAIRETENAAAYDAYLDGRYLRNQRTPETLQRSVQAFLRAIRLDANFALAYAGLADSYALLGVYEVLPTRQAFPMAKIAAEMALARNEAIAEVHATLGFVKTFFEWDWHAGEAEFRRAIELNSTYATARHWYAIHLMSLGRTSESLAQMSRAQQLDPLSPIINTDVAEMYYWAGQYDRARAECRRTLEMYPRYYMAHCVLGWVHVQSGNLDQAKSEFQKAAEIVDDDPWVIVGLGYIHAAEGRRGAAEQALNELDEVARRRSVSPHAFAVMQVALGNAEAALTRLEESYDRRVVQLNWLKIDPRFRPLHSEPRFADLLRRLGLE
jgi:DNA-binding winged helix-turn-helix (wHTH) protein/TolB-like protein/Flp pilus assembly protein TadD